MQYITIKETINIQLSKKYLMFVIGFYKHTMYSIRASPSVVQISISNDSLLDFDIEFF